MQLRRLMGAWNCSLVGNDAFQDELHEFNQTRLSQVGLYLSNWHNLAQKEAEGFMLSEDHLPLEYDESIVKEDYLFNEDQDVIYRSIFLGLIDVCLTEKPDLLKYFTKKQLENGLEFGRQLSYHKILNQWKEPQTRLSELYNFHLRLKHHLATLSD